MAECGSIASGTMTMTPPMTEDVVELTLLLPGMQAAALEAAAFHRGLTAGELVRRLVRDFLRAQNTTNPVKPITFAQQPGV